MFGLKVSHFAMKMLKTGLIETWQVMTLDALDINNRWQTWPSPTATHSNWIPHVNVHQDWTTMQHAHHPVVMLSVCQLWTNMISDGVSLKLFWYLYGCIWLQLLRKTISHYMQNKITPCAAQSHYHPISITGWPQISMCVNSGTGWICLVKLN